jgi:hypothetical protein
MKLKSASLNWSKKAFAHRERGRRRRQSCLHLSTAGRDYVAMRGVVDQNIDATEFADSLVHDRPAMRGVQNIAREQDGFAAGVLDQALGLLGVLMLAEIGDQQVGALARKDRTVSSATRHIILQTCPCIPTMFKKCRNPRTALQFIPGASRHGSRRFYRNGGGRNSQDVQGMIPVALQLFRNCRRTGFVRR